MKGDSTLAKRTDEEQDILYVLRRPDGSIRAELPLPPSLAEKINASRRKRGFFDGDWVPQERREYGLWHLDPDTMPNWMLDLLKKAQQKERNEVHVEAKPEN